MGYTAALATIIVYENENLLENTIVMGKDLDSRMGKRIAKHPSIGDYRNTGLFGVIELVKNRETKEPITP